MGDPATFVKIAVFLVTATCSAWQFLALLCGEWKNYIETKFDTALLFEEWKNYVEIGNKVWYSFAL